MATYQELFDLSSNSALRNKAAVAIVVAADTVRSEPDATPNHAARVAWANTAADGPEREARKALWLVLAANRATTQEGITSASDTAIQTAINDAIDLMATT